MAVYRAKSNDCGKCTHQAVCKWEKERMELAGEIEGLFDGYDFSAPFTVIVDCKNFDPVKSAPRDLGKELSWNF